MKRMLLILIPALLLSLRSHSQVPHPMDGGQVFSGGLVAGLNVSQVDGDYLNGYHKAGFTAGFAGYAHFSPLLHASMELLFSQKGSNSVRTAESPSVGTYFAHYRIGLNYAEVPVLFHVAYQRYQFGAGVSYNALISSREEYNDASFTTTIDKEQYPFRRHSFDGILNAGMVLWRGLMMQARYQYSLSPIRRYADIPPGLGFENQKNNMFSFRLLYLF